MYVYMCVCADDIDINSITNGKLPSVKHLQSFWIYPSELFPAYSIFFQAVVAQGHSEIVTRYYPAAF